MVELHPIITGSRELGRVVTKEPEVLPPPPTPPPPSGEGAEGGSGDGHPIGAAQTTHASSMTSNLMFAFLEAQRELGSCSDEEVFYGGSGRSSINDGILGRPPQKDDVFTIARKEENKDTVSIPMDSHCKEGGTMNTVLSTTPSSLSYWSTRQGDGDVRGKPGDYIRVIHGGGGDGVPPYLEHLTIIPNWNVRCPHPT